MRGHRVRGNQAAMGRVVVDKAKEGRVNDAEVAAGVLLAGFLDGICNHPVVEMALAALEAGLAISVVGIYRPTHHSPFHF